MSNEYRWLTPESQQFLERDYLLPGQTVDHRVNQIAEKAESILGIEGYAVKFKKYFQKGWFSLSTPIWTNFGIERGLPISCFGSCIEDSMVSILSTHAEVGMMSKVGGGTSGYFGNLRHRGAPIRDNGESFGSVHFMQLFDNLINIVSQGKTRRGNFAAYLSIEHEDIHEFLEIRSEGNPLQDLFTGITVSDEWMQSMIDGDQDKRTTWAKVLSARTNTGFPYIMFSDNVNNNTVDVYKDLGMKILHSNLCVTGDQLTITNKGIRTVYDLYEEGCDLELFDGEKSVKASPMKLIEKQAAVFEVITKNGRSHKITDYHKLKTDHGMIALKDLSIGDKICIQKNKGLFGNIKNPEMAFLLGLYQSDGTQDDKAVFIDLWEHDFDLIDKVENYIELVYKQEGWETYEVNVPNKGKHQRTAVIPKFTDQNTGCSDVGKKRLQSAKLKQYGFVKGCIPSWIWEADEITQWSYIQGLYFADGSVTLSESHGQPISLSLPCINKEFLRQVQILLSNLGIATSIYAQKEEGDCLLPNGKGGYELYRCQAQWRLVCGNKPDCINFEKNTGFLSRKNVFLEDRVYRDNRKKYDEISEINFIGWEDVYCTTVDSDEHVWVCNSFITSNCSEIMLPDNNEESFVCDLSSMNILYYEEWKDTDCVEVLTFLLDAVMTDFIDKAKDVPFMEKSVRFAERHRALGIGWLGWHSYLQSKMIPFESMESKMLNTQVAKCIKEQAWAASAKLADMFGEPEILKGYGRRNTTLTAIAPTKSSAFILGQVSEGIEPHRANYYIKDLQKGKFTVRNIHLEELLETKGKNTIEVWDSILKNAGSVQHLSFLSDHEKSVFKTFIEISPKEIIIQAGQRQRHVDQSQSLNLLIDPKVPAKDVNTLLIDAWRLGVKSLYYQISVNAAQQLTRSILTCQSCES